MNGPHQNQPLLKDGEPIESADAGVVLVHGRGATARSIIAMSEEFHHEGVAYVAPQASNNTWYPNSFLSPVESNEPGRTSGLQAIRDAIDELNSGVPTEKILVLGFSQGACLGSEYVARNPMRYGGLAVLSGGLIGSGPEVDPDDYEVSLNGTPVFIGCSDVDPHIPLERVNRTAEIFEMLEGDVTKKIYENMGHGVNQDELDYVSDMIGSLLD